MRVAAVSVLHLQGQIYDKSLWNVVKIVSYIVSLVRFAFGICWLEMRGFCEDIIKYDMRDKDTFSRSGIYSEASVERHQRLQAPELQVFNNGEPWTDLFSYLRTLQLRMLISQLGVQEVSIELLAS